MLLLVSSVARADQRSSSKSCGIYCMFAVLQWYGYSVDPQSLAKPEYLSDPDGSTLADLKKLAEAHGLFAHPVKDVSSHSLELMAWPIVLSVRPSPEDKAFNHYTVVFPSPGHRTVYDPTTGSFHSLADLSLGLWDGHALILSDVPLSMKRVFWREYLLLFSIVALLFILRLTLSSRLNALLPQSMSSWLRVTTSGVLLISVASLMAVAAELTWRQQPLTKSTATEAIQQRHLDAFIPKLSADDVAQAVKEEALIVDARLAEDYEAGHIETAVNIGPSSDPSYIEQALGRYPATREIIIYCQSAGCPYAGYVAGLLWKKGYHNLAYYKAGWVEWENLAANRESSQP